MPTTVREQREELADQVRDLAGKAAAEHRDLTPDEQQQISADLTKVKAYDDQIRAGEQTQDLVRQISALPDMAKSRGAVDNSPSFTMGEHFVKSAAYGEMLERKSVTRFTAGTTDFIPGRKAPGDPLLTTGLGQPQYGPVVQTPLRQPTITDLLSSGTLTGSSLVYFQQGAVSGGFTAVAEGALKPFIDFAFAPVTEPLAKIAGVTKISDEMSEDQAAVVSVIDSQLRLRLALAEEAQIVSGSGTPPNLTGILLRSGIQTEAAATAADNLDAIYRAITKVQTATQLAATGIAVHPTDYQKQRLAKDLNGQYFGGGPFLGGYGEVGTSGQPAFVVVPPLWGLPTVVTTAVPVGTAIVAAWAAGAQFFRKGGVRVESTNSDGDDFRYNRIAIRAEERVLLAVYIPAAFVKVTLL